MIILEDILSTEPRHSQLNSDTQIFYQVPLGSPDLGVRQNLISGSVAYKLDFIPITLHFIILKTGITVPRQSRHEVTVTCYTQSA